LLVDRHRQFEALKASTSVSQEQTNAPSLDGIDDLQIFLFLVDQDVTEIKYARESKVGGKRGPNPITRGPSAFLAFGFITGTRDILWVH
jgi:hypothetical protein